MLKIFNKIKLVFFQIVHQFPCSFEFNDRFLTFLSDNAYNSDFGTFLADSDYERVKVKKLQKKWGHPLRTSVCGWSDLFAHMRTASVLVFTFIDKGLKTTKLKSTACSSKKIKTNHHGAFCTTH